MFFRRRTPDRFEGFVAQASGDRMLSPSFRSTQPALSFLSCRSLTARRYSNPYIILFPLRLLLFFYLILLVHAFLPGSKIFQSLDAFSRLNTTSRTPHRCLESENTNVSNEPTELQTRRTCGRRDGTIRRIRIAFARLLRNWFLLSSTFD